MKLSKKILIKRNAKGTSMGLLLLLIFVICIMVIGGQEVNEGLSTLTEL